MLQTFDKSTIDARDIAEQLLGQQGRRVGDALMFRAPWRDDGRKAGLAVYADGYKDFGGDGRSGDVIDLIQQVNGCDFKAALEYLGQPAQFVRIERPPAPAQQLERNEPPAEAWQQAMRRFMADAQQALQASEKALQYLKGRGISAEAAQQAGLGWAADWIDTGYSDDSGPVRCAPGIIIPWEFQGQLHSLRVRTPHDRKKDALLFDAFTVMPKEAGDKYLSIRGSKPSAGLFVIDKGTDHAVIVEGEFDAIVAAELTGLTAITRGSASACARVKGQALEFIGQHAQTYLLFDNDTAGQQAAEALQGQIRNAQQLELPAGIKDITEAWQQGKADNILQEAKARAFAWWTGIDLPRSWRAALQAFAHGGIAALAEIVQEAVYDFLLDPLDITESNILKIQQYTRIQLDEKTLRRAYKEADGLLWENGQLLERIEVKHRLLEWIKPRIIEHLVDPQFATLITEAMAKSLEVELDEFDIATVNDWLKQYLPEEQIDAFKQVEKTLKKWRYELGTAQFDPLPVGWTIASPADYRAAVAHAIVAAEPGIVLSNARFAELLGCTPNYVAKVLKRANVERGWKNKEGELVQGIRKKSVLVIPTMKAIEAACTEHQGFAWALREHPDHPMHELKPFVHLIHGPESDPLPEVLERLQERYKSSGGKFRIELIMHVAYEHYIASEEQPVKEEKQADSQKCDPNVLEDHGNTFDPEGLDETEDEKEERAAKGRKRAVYGPKQDPDWTLQALRNTAEQLGINAEGDAKDIFLRICNVALLASEVTEAWQRRWPVKMSRKVQ